MKLPNAILVFIFSYLALILFLVRGNVKNRELIKEIINTISSSFILVSIFMMVYNEYGKIEESKKKRVVELNTISSELLNNIYGMFFQNQATLSNLHKEIFQQKYETPKDKEILSLSYQEYLALQVIYSFFLNVYRQYVISGGEQDKISEDLYESINTLIVKTTKSPKGKMFWNNNKTQFESLGFIEWMDKKYF